MFFSDILRGPDASVISDSGGSVWKGMLGSGGVSSTGMRVTPETAMALPMLQNCVTLLAESLANCPCEVLERTDDGGRKPAVDLPLYDLLRYAPNPVQTPHERVEVSQVSAGLRGNSYSFIERDGNGQPLRMWPLDADKVQVLKGPDLLPYYRVSGVADPLPMRLVHHVRWHSSNGYVGMSPVQLHAESLGLAMAVRQFSSKSFANGAAIAGVIERPREVTPIKDQASIDAITDQWGQKYSGVDNAKKVALLQEGMSFKPISMNNVDAELIALTKATGADIARLYKIPLPMVNELDKLSYNSLEQQLIQFVVYALLAWAKRHEQALMRDLLLPEQRKRYFIEFNLSGLMRGDQKSRYESYAIGRQWGWLSVNDIRRLENLPPVAGGDIYLQPLNMVDVTNGLPDLNNPKVRAQLESQQRELQNLLAQ